MKKSVIIIILVIYVASIAIVGIFGTKIMSYNATIYVTNIECINEEAQDGTMVVDGRNVAIKTILIDFTQQQTFWLQWRVYPEDATTKNVTFSSGTTSVASINEETGLITFNKKGTITVHITATDGTSVKAIVKVTAWNITA